MDRTTLPPHWSPSALLAYLRCPAAFYFGRVLGLDEQEGSPNLALGSALHAAQAFALARFKSSHLPPVEEMKEVFCETLDLFAADPRYTFAEGQAESLREDGLLYCELLHKGYGREQVVAVEQEIVAPAVDPVTGEELSRPIKSLLDLVVRTDDGEILVVDLKSSGSRSAWSTERLRSDLQATLYAYCAERVLPGAHGRVRFDVLFKFRHRPVVEKYVVSRGAEDYRRAFALIKQVESAIASGYFAPTAEGTWQCGTCGHRDACASWHHESLPVAANVGRAVA